MGKHRATKARQDLLRDQFFDVLGLDASPLQLLAEINLEKVKLKIDSIPGEIALKVENLYVLFREKKEQIQTQKNAFKRTEADFDLLKRKHKKGDISDREFDRVNIEHEGLLIELNTLEYEAVMLRAEIDLLCANDIRWLIGPLEVLEGVPFKVMMGDR